MSSYRNSKYDGSFELLRVLPALRFCMSANE